MDEQTADEYLSSLGVEQGLIPCKCLIHGEFEGKRFEGPGEVYVLDRCPKCEQEKKQNQEEKENQRKATQRAEEKKRALAASLPRRLEQSEIPPRYLGKGFDAYEAVLPGQTKALKECRHYAENFPDLGAKGVSMIFIGGMGTGKTYLGCAILEHIIRHHGKDGLFITVAKAIRSVKETWKRKNDRSEQEALDSLVRPSLLVLDEVGVQFGSETEKRILFDIVNDRYAKNKPTIFISNYKIDEISEFIGGRLIDRLKEDGGRVVIFNWGSYRVKAPQPVQTVNQ